MPEQHDQAQARRGPAPPEPAQSQPAQPEPAQSQPPQSQSAQPEPAQPESAESQSAQPEPAQSRSAQAEPAQPEPALPEPVLRETVTVPSAARMRELGERLAGVLAPGDLIVLSGGLGAGKTTLTQGIGAGLGVRGPVTSPTFVIARVHPSLRGGPDLVHADAYRLGGPAEVDDLDLDADVDRSVTVVEWGEGLAERLAPSFLEIAIAPAAGEAAAGRAAAGEPAAAGSGPDPDAEPRTVRVTGWGDRWRRAAPAARAALSG